MSAAKSMLVPNHTIVRSTEKQFVISVIDGKASVTNIKEGLVGADSTEIFGDIKPGDKIILHATDEIRQGTKIN